MVGPTLPHSHPWGQLVHAPTTRVSSIVLPRKGAMPLSGCCSRLGARTALPSHDLGRVQHSRLVKMASGKEREWGEVRRREAYLACPCHHMADNWHGQFSHFDGQGQLCTVFKYYHGPGWQLRPEISASPFVVTNPHCCRAMNSDMALSGSTGQDLPWP